MSRILAVTLLCCGLWTVGEVARAGQEEPAPPASAAPHDEKLSDAERIARLLRSIETDEKLLSKLRSDLEDPKGEYRQAETQFKKLDEQIAAIRSEAQSLRDAGKADQAAEMMGDVQPVMEEWQSARVRFNLAIEERKILHSKMAALQLDIEHNQRNLDLLTGAAAESSGKRIVAPVRKPTQPTKPADSANKAQVAEGTASEPAAKPVSQQLQKAQEDAVSRATKAKEAKDRIPPILERLEAVRKEIEIEQKLQETARKQADQAQETQTTLNRVMQKLVADKAPEAALRGILQKIGEAEKREARARAESRESADQLRELEIKAGGIREEHAAAVAEAQQRQVEAERAQKLVAELENPFTWNNLLRWLKQHAWRACGIILGMCLLRRLATMGTCRITTLMAHHSSRTTPEEAQHRAETLTGVFRSTAVVAILGGGSLMLLDELGVPIVTLVGGAAVVGLAVAFGAQNLIRDYFSGFMVLLEDQYGIGDVVKIGSVSGAVEKITLRITVLRDDAGSLHFIPHGTISTVTNLTHGWSKACFAIDISYNEDVDRVLNVLFDLCHEICRDPQYAAMILEEPQLGGISTFDDSSVVVKFSLKTLPMKQWAIEKEMLRRIKRRFDEQHIEMPYPHRTIYHRMDGNLPPGVMMRTAGNGEAA